MEMRANMLWIAAWSAVACLMFAWAWRMVEWLWLKPRRLERQLRAQGLRGTPYRPLFGDIKEEARQRSEACSKPMSPISHCIVPRVSPFLHRTMEEHGKMSFTWFGPTPRVTIMDPDLVREILSNKFGNFVKPGLNPLGRLLVTGLANYEGEKWAKHRRITTPAFHLDKLKDMFLACSSASEELISRWEKIAASKGICELDLLPEIGSFTGDVISRTAFGSSYKEGKRLFELQEEQTNLFLEAVQNLYIPGYRYLPTVKNSRRKEIYREVQDILRSMIEQRERAISQGKPMGTDLLILLTESNLRYSQEDKETKNAGLTIEEVIEECKLFYFTGHVTTMVLLTWTMIVLSMYPDWQARAREEVLQVFGKNKPELDGLIRLKVVTMVVYEVLRLYPPSTMLFRKTSKEMKLGGITFPAGVHLLLPLIHLSHDPDIWGENASEFNPERFSEGLSKASKPQGSFFPFGWGPRICIGQSFALWEVKTALAKILQHFTFELSPTYAHAPSTVIALQPQYGAHIILHKL